MDMKHATIFFSCLTAFMIGCQSSATETPVEQTNSTETIEKVDRIEYPQAVTFPSLDGLLISANIYGVNPDAPVILLCHQARYNKFEYAGIAEKLNEKGFNCIAIDQRSGGPIANQVNETTLRALEAEKPIEFLDAEQDIIAAIRYAKSQYSGKLILWGSSYSSTLALYLGVDMSEVDAVISFSPGNYLADKKGSLIDHLKGFEKPVFVTSSKPESADVKKLLAKLPMKENQIRFAPNGRGHHGSRALWPHQSDSEEYWSAIDSFLTTLK